MRAGLAPEHQERVVVVPGEPGDLLAGRFTRVPNPEFNSHNRPERASEVQGTLDRLADDLIKSPEDRLEAMEW